MTQTLIYATHDADGGRIESNADIRAFTTEAEAREWLLKSYRDGGWDLTTAKIEAGRFGDCWIKTYSEPREDGDKLVIGAGTCEPFSPEQLYVAAPGQHPGGRVWWIEPNVEVLVVAEIHEAE